ncbi:MAG: excinuclease ABC subunit UvrC [Defluviitaleaceae bacterium]|nr:excinuclease ABC subunit UvrC [Defluviitaleaceae bacterium]
MFNIPEELKKLPQKPGVYIMKNSNDAVIYVGKAKSLRNRVRQYFLPSNADYKVANMVPHITHFEYIVTDTELEALILECTLIKKHTPKYNILLKDDKTYPYMKLTLNESFPRLLKVRQFQKDKGKYYGPYSSVRVIGDTIELAHNIWKIRTCGKNFPNDIGKSRPCLNYDIGKCAAPCAGLISEEEYNVMINDIIAFLGGKYEEIVKRLERQMIDFAEELRFEEAEIIRKKIISIRSLTEKQKMENLTESDQDIIAFAESESEALVQVFFIRAGKMTGREHFMVDKPEDASKQEIITSFIQQFYSETTYIPKEIITEHEVEEKELITKWLSEIKGQSTSLITPKKGEKHKLIQLASKNAEITLNQFGEAIKSEERRTTGAVSEIKEALKLENNIERIEAYDISNIMGYEAVASMVVFENGKPKRSDYRKFKIKYTVGANDTASMNEVIFRRFTRYKNETSNPEINKPGKFSSLPDIIFVDGGKGQISAAQAALKDLGISIPVCGMVKDDKHRTRGLMFDNSEITFKASSEGFKLVTRIQDEVHRFAITYHRKLREKSAIKSILDDIPGIGGTRRKALLKHFGDIENISKASVEELADVQGMNNKAAEAVYRFFTEGGK